MITWICDVCSKTVEHPETYPPKNWAVIRTVVSVCKEDDGRSSEWENDHAAALCETCCTTGLRLSDIIDGIVRNGLTGLRSSVNVQKSTAPEPSTNRCVLCDKDMPLDYPHTTCAECISAGKLL